MSTHNDELCTEEKRIYDIHCHAFNLNHPSLTTLIQCFNIPSVLLFNSFFGPLASLILGNKMNKIRNLLSVMENDIENMFLLMENCLKNCSGELIKDKKIHIGEGLSYSKMVLTPLVMDFGYKEFKLNHIHYNKPFKKPVVEQVTDLLTGIRDYCSKYDYGQNMFEIHPFLGINTQNYRFGKKNSIITEQKPNLHLLPESIRKKTNFRYKSKRLVFHGEMNEYEKNEIKKVMKTKSDKKTVESLYKNTLNLSSRNSVPRMLDKYFSNYHHSRSDLLENMGKFDGDIENIGSNFFAGIKVYPPLGFDPWPENDREELMKVKYLYKYCISKNIPITTHCASGGFTGSTKLLLENTDPSKWEKVLRSYPKLKINIAHMGAKNVFFDLFPTDTWRKKVLHLVEKYDNVYTDISCCGINEGYYKFLRELIDSFEPKSRQKFRERILFGTDFSINLLWCDSYGEYFEFFSNTKYLTDEEKDLFCSKNPERFLFGD